jgi:hypothetical protein
MPFLPVFYRRKTPTGASGSPAVATCRARHRPCGPARAFDEGALSLDEMAKSIERLDASQMILVMASIGIARMTPSKPNIQHQNTIARMTSTR